MVTNQAYLFCIFIINGIIIGILFDFFRILRKTFKTSDLITYIEDSMFWILTGIIFYTLSLFLIMEKSDFLYFWELYLAFSYICFYLVRIL